MPLVLVNWVPKVFAKNSYFFTKNTIRVPELYVDQVTLQATAVNCQTVGIALVLHIGVVHIFAV